MGLAINSGKSFGHVCLYASNHHQAVVPHDLVNDTEVAEEIARLDVALKECSQDLDRIVLEVSEHVGEAEGSIFTAQKHILNDPAIIAAITLGVRTEKKNLEYILDRVFDGYEEKFAKLDNEYFRERSTDIGEMRRRLLDKLYNTRPGFICQGQHDCSRGKDRIIVAEELTAEMMVHMKLESLLGIVTERGGITSHAAIIARSMGIPAVSGVRGVYSQVQCGTRILVDGDAGMVLLNPDAEIVAAAIPKEPQISENICYLETPAGMEVLANASLVEDAHQAAFTHADGIGLFRTEILFMRAQRRLTLEEQSAMYRDVLSIMKHKPVTFRMLDVGGDKELPFLRIEKETNPYLGWRGARFLLGSPDIFETQIRALLRQTNEHIVRILFPMVIDSKQMQELLAFVRAIMATENVRSENVRIGAMFEVPSACLDADAIFKSIDFASIGSNDLIQYIFAVDRNNDLVSQDYNPDHPILWKVLQDLANSAKQHKKPLSICGEMAGRPDAAAKLCDIGITSFSVSPRLVNRVRNEISRYCSRGITI